MAEVNLDALCDMLDDSDEEIEGFQQEANVENEATEDDLEDPNEVSAMEEQLKMMQEQMRLMQQKLAEKKNKTTSSQSSSSPTPTKPGLKPSTSSSSPASVTKPRTHLQEVNLFNVPEQAVAQARGSSGRSPVKTNPFESYDKPVRLAKLNPETPQFGPALPKKVTRVLSGEDRIKFEASLKQSDERKKIMEVSKDLDLSSDDDTRDEDSNPLGSRYNDYGKGISKLLNASQNRVEHERPKQSQGMSQDLGKKPVGFNSVQGASLNLSNSTNNALLPKGMIIEKNSRIRISNPEITQVSFDLSLIGRKFISIQRLKNAVAIKETDSDWATIGVVYFKSTQTSKNGNTYTLLKLTDLLGDIETCSLYLFGRANAKFYSIPLNRVIGILNAKVMDNSSKGNSGGSSKNEVSLSIDHPDKLMEIGDSLDVSRCQAKKNDGSGCTNLVNKSSCEYCTYHVKKAYKSISAKRGDLQSAFSGNADVRARIMAKVAPKGEVFGGGQIMNLPQTGLVGRRNIKQTQKDQNVLTGLGVVTVPAPSNTICRTKVDKLLADTPGSRLMNDHAFFQPGSGKLTFRSHLSEAEREAVKKVAKGVSEELGLKLLNPTAGARTLMKHLTKQDPLTLKAEEEAATMTKLEIDNRLKQQKQLEAKKLLCEQKQIAKRTDPASFASPKLGRGLGSGGFVDLTSPKPSSISKNLDPTKLKALLALKGKSLKKEDPNNVLKRKRSSDDLQNLQKKVASKLDASLTCDDVPSAKDDQLDESDKRFIQAVKKSKGEKPKEIRSLTGEIIDEKRMAELRKIRSANHNLAEEAEVEAEEKYFEKLEKKEAMEEKMRNTREIESTVVTCKICQYTAMTQSDLCKNSFHPVKKIKALKKFFECLKCKKRTFCFDRYPKRPCNNCGESSWARTSMMKERKGPLLDSEKLLVRGVEQKYINANVSSASLNLEL